MPRTRSPRAGSMQFWPRSRSVRGHARIRTWPRSSEVKPLGFAGYKVGMTHLLIIDNKPTSMMKGKEIICPVTVVECPPLKVHSIRFYKNSHNNSTLISELLEDNPEKDVEKKTKTPKKKGKEAENFDFLRLLCHTQPKLTGIGKKIPEIIEIALGGPKEQQLKYAREKIGKEIMVNDSFKEGQLLDLHSITRGKGFQGALKRFGVTLRHHKSEKSRRNPGTLGSWKAQGHIMWRTAHAGKMGYHMRTEYNKWLVKVGAKPEEINVKGGFLHYGLVKNSYILVKGSLGGPSKRLLRFTDASRQKIQAPDAPQIVYTSIESKQGK